MLVCSARVSCCCYRVCYPFFLDEVNPALSLCAGTPPHVPNESRPGPTPVPLPAPSTPRIPSFVAATPCTPAKIFSPSLSNTPVPGPRLCSSLMSAASRNLSVAASHESLYLSLALNGVGSVLSAFLTHSENCSLVSYVMQFGNVPKNSLLGCLAQMTYLPMANASAVVVATTSESDGLMNTL